MLNNHSYDKLILIHIARSIELYDLLFLLIVKGKQSYHETKIYFIFLNSFKLKNILILIIFFVF
jgi:hypothetical protein